MATYPTGAIHRPVDNFCWDTGTMSWIMSTCGSGTGGGGGPIQDGVDPTIEATVLDLTDSNPLTVAIVDSNGDQISSFGGGVDRTVTATLTGFVDTDISLVGAQTFIIVASTTNYIGQINAQTTVNASPTTGLSGVRVFEVSDGNPATLTRLTNMVFTGGTVKRTFVVFLAGGETGARITNNVHTSGSLDIILRAVSTEFDYLGLLIQTDGTYSGLMTMGLANSGVPNIPTVDGFGGYTAFSDGFVSHIASGNNPTAPVTVRLGDGTNSADVKAASTAAIATDKAQVVAISPNNVIATSAAGNTSASGTITANGQSVQITVPPGGGGVGIQITGVWTGQIDFQASLNGSDWEPVNTSNGVNSINATAFDGVFILAASGYGYIKAIATAWTSGTATILMNGSVGAGPVLLSSPLPQGANIIGKVGIDQTTPGTTNAVSLSQVGGAAITLGQKAMAASTPVVIASDQSAVPIDGSNTFIEVFGTVTLSDPVDQGSPNVVGQANGWWQRITDGTNGPVTVTAPSTAALATDRSLVVALNPNTVPTVNQGDGNNQLDQPWTIGISDSSTGYVAVKPASTAAAAADKALVVAISPNNTVAVTGAGTQYTEDDASAGGESLTLAGAIRSDVPTSSQSADGDYANLKTDASGRLWVNAREGNVVDGQFFPSLSVASKLDEVIFTNKQVVAAMLLLLNQVNSRTSVTQRDLVLN